MKHLRVFIGPVQDFISAGRRTRDYWAGSFLLSRLAGEAMAKIITGGGEIVLPAVYDDKSKTVSEPTLAAILETDPKLPCLGPLVGTLVNHFAACVPDDFDANQVTNAIQSRFKAIADAVYNYFLCDLVCDLSDNKKAEVKDRWDFQTDGKVFEILWVEGKNDAAWQDQSSWLSQRKSFRSHKPLLEHEANLAGTADRCPVHPELCEIGGFSRIIERKVQDEFWCKLRSGISNSVYGDAAGKYIETLEIKDGERLSAVALVKRLFPLLPATVIAQVIGWVPYHRPSGSEVPSPDEAQYALRNWPSTAFLSAVPFVVMTAKNDAEKAKTFSNEILKGLGTPEKYKSEKIQFHRMKNIAGITEDVGAFAVLDGRLHLPDGLKQDVAEKINHVKLLKTLHDNPNKIQPPSQFYAFLDMDGDSMGRWFSQNEDLAQRSSKRLLDFAAKVPNIIYEHDGALLFAGADDVNAMLPIETAIAAAVKIREHWQCVWKDADNPPSISASIVFADYKFPLDDTRRLTHQRLNDVAKDFCGRDAIALAVVKSGGVSAEWADKWDNKAITPLLEMAKNLGERSTSTLASRLPYLLRERFHFMFNSERLFISDDHMKLLVQKELFDSGKQSADSMTWASNLLKIMLPKSTEADGTTPKSTYRIDGLLIARFLGTNIHWPYYDMMQGDS